MTDPTAMTAEEKAKILDKIQKLFNLAQGKADLNESSLALKMAQDLLEKYDLTIDQVEEAKVVGSILTDDIVSIASATRTKNWELRLMDAIAQGYGCRLLFARGYPFAKYLFIGSDMDIKVAGYAARVLQRQLSRARATFTRDLPSWMSRPVKTREIDAYCLGWVSAAIKLLPRLINHPAKEEAIAKFVKQIAGGSRVKMNPRQGLDGSQESIHRGLEDGKEAQLNRPMDGGSPGPAPRALPAAK